MGLTSPFPSRVRRAMLPPIGLQTVFREVRTEDELRQALTPLDVGTTAALVANTGRRIVIAASITLKSPIIISASLPGTTIESHGKLPIFCGADGIDAFVVRAQLCTIRDLLITSPDVTGVAVSASFRRAVTADTGGDSLRVLDVDVFGCATLVHGADGVEGVHVRGCSVLTPGVANGDAVYFDGNGWRIIGNVLAGAGTGIAIECGASAGRAAIIGNDCGGEGITTSAGTGLNTVSSNTDAGTLTTHATDAVGLNT